MADIAKCKDVLCPLKESCYRYNAPINEYHQSYFKDSPRDLKITRCDYYWKMNIIKETNQTSMNNSIMIIQPYWKYGTWCFSDSTTGLIDEAFVAGMDIIITHMLIKKNISLADASKGFNLTFSGTYFPDYDIVINHIKPDDSNTGNYYELDMGEDGKFTGWLCPALYKYFSETPKQIYAKVEPLKELV